MGFSFDRPTGPTADVLELEYVSALMQTDENLRPDASLVAEDISLLLMSRHGIDITPEEVTEKLLKAFTNRSTSQFDLELREEPEVEESKVKANDSKLRDVLAGDDLEGEELKEKLNDSKLNDDLTGDTSSVAKLDLMEFVALLMIPQLMAPSGDRQQCEEGQYNPENFENEIFQLFEEHALVKTDADSKGTDVFLTKDLMKNILTNLGERKMANDVILVEDMVNVITRQQVLSDKESSPVAKLNAKTFYRALIGDVINAYEPALVGNTVTLDDKETDIGESKDTTTAQAKRVMTAPFLDFSADRFSYWTLVVCQWVFFAMSFLTYYSGMQFFITSPECDENQDFVPLGTWSDNSGALACTIRWSVVRWLYLVAVMSIYGVVYFGLTGLGSTMGDHSVFCTLLGAISALVFTFTPLSIPAFQRDGNKIDIYLKVTTSAFGAVVCLLNLWLFFIALIEKFQPDFYELHKEYFVPTTTRNGNLLKNAGTKKVNTILHNAFDMHKGEDGTSAYNSHQGPVMFKYLCKEECTENVGGFSWTWTKIRNGDILKNEGIWYSGRLISINASQFLLSTVILIAGIAITHKAKDDWVPPLDPTLAETVAGKVFRLAPSLKDIGSDIISQMVLTVLNFTNSNDLVSDCPEVDSDTFRSMCGAESLEGCRDAAGNWLCAMSAYQEMMGETNWNMDVQARLLELSGFYLEEIESAALSLTASTAQNTIETLYPAEAYMVVAPLVVFTLVAFITALVISFMVIPSVTTTTLKLRTGIISLAKDPRIMPLRHATDRMHYLRGGMFWGTILSSVIMGGVAGLVLFVLLYQNTAWKLQLAVAVIIGVIIIGISEALLVRGCMFYSHGKAFYRERPFSANVFALSRECAFIALTVWFTISRVVILMIVSTLFVGRVDIPFLSPGVGEVEKPVRLKLDKYPDIFLTDVLQHEAHRHPYIEIFSGLCILKLEKGEEFISKAGSAWRLVFLLSLMPWLTKYRRMTNSELYSTELDDEVHIEELLAEIKVLKEKLVDRDLQISNQEENDSGKGIHWVF